MHHRGRSERRVPTSAFHTGVGRAQARLLLLVFVVVTWARTGFAAGQYEPLRTREGAGFTGTVPDDASARFGGVYAAWRPRPPSFPVEMRCLLDGRNLTRVTHVAVQRDVSDMLRENVFVVTLDDGGASDREVVAQVREPRDGVVWEAVAWNSASRIGDSSRLNVVAGLLFRSRQASLALTGAYRCEFYMRGVCGADSFWSAYAYADLAGDAALGRSCRDGSPSLRFLFHGADLSHVTVVWDFEPADGGKKRVLAQQRHSRQHGCFAPRQRLENGIDAYCDVLPDRRLAFELAGLDITGEVRADVSFVSLDGYTRSVERVVSLDRLAYRAYRERCPKDTVPSFREPPSESACLPSSVWAYVLILTAVIVAATMYVRGSTPYRYIVPEGWELEDYATEMASASASPCALRKSAPSHVGPGGIPYKKVT